MIVEIRILNLEDDVITSGFILNCHYEGNEVEMSIQKMKDKENKYKVFAKKNEVILAVVKTSEKISVYKNMKLIFRKDNYTIGFGKVIKIKK